MQAGSSNRELLAVALEKVRNQISAVRSARQKISEQDTKGSMIEPILASLGWDTSDLSEVRREYRHTPKDDPVDYAFLSSQGQPIMFVEAKAIGHSIDDHKKTAQIVNYANSAGVEICILTNGDEYRVFNTHAKVPLQEKQIARVSLVEDDPQKTFAVLEGLSRVGLLEQRIMLQWQREQLESSVRLSLAKLVAKPDKYLVTLIANSLKGRVSEDSISGILKGAELSLVFTADANVAAKVLNTGKNRGSKLSKTSGVERKSPTSFNVTLSDLIAAGYLKPPLELKCIYKKNELSATLHDDGSVEFEGERYESLSLAAGNARNTVSGPPPDGRAYYPTNGWSFWKVMERGSGKLISLTEIRDSFMASDESGTGKSRLSLL